MVLPSNSVSKKYLLTKVLGSDYPRGYSHKILINIPVCAAQRDRDFGAPELERGIHFRDVFYILGSFFYMFISFTNNL